MYHSKKTDGCSIVFILLTIIMITMTIWVVSTFVIEGNHANKVLQEGTVIKLDVNVQGVIASKYYDSVVVSAEWHSERCTTRINVKELVEQFPSTTFTFYVYEDELYSKEGILAEC